ncbi:hypothetical protein M885DRAFT_612320, partial [Pelagophyceae sp. CCMP2097]
DVDDGPGPRRVQGHAEVLELLARAQRRATGTVVERAAVDLRRGGDAPRRGGEDAREAPRKGRGFRTPPRVVAAGDWRVRRRGRPRFRPPGQEERRRDKKERRLRGRVRQHEPRGPRHRRAVEDAPRGRLQRRRRQDADADWLHRAADQGRGRGPAAGAAAAAAGRPVKH